MPIAACPGAGSIVSTGTGDPSSITQPVEPGRGKHGRIGLAARDLVEPGLHIAADRLDMEVGAKC